MDRLAPKLPGLELKHVATSDPKILSGSVTLGEEKKKGTVFLGAIFRATKEKGKRVLKN